MLTIIWAFKELYSFSNRNIKDHRPQIARANIMTVKMFEILGASPKCDIETGSEQMLLEKWHWRTYLSQGCHKPLICKNTVCAKCKKVQWNKICLWKCRFCHCLAFVLLNFALRGAPQCAAPVQTGLTDLSTEKTESCQRIQMCSSTTALVLNCFFFHVLDD